MKCQKCGEDFEEYDIQSHHIHPRFMDNKKGDGERANLCEKCHNILHFKIAAVLWNYIPSNFKPLAIEGIIKYTKDQFK